MEVVIFSNTDGLTVCTNWKTKDQQNIFSNLRTNMNVYITNIWNQIDTYFAVDWKLLLTYGISIFSSEPRKSKENINCLWAIHVLRLWVSGWMTSFSDFLKSVSRSTPFWLSLPGLLSWQFPGDTFLWFSNAPSRFKLGKKWRLYPLTILSISSSRSLWLNKYSINLRTISVVTASFPWTPPIIFLDKIK